MRDEYALHGAALLDCYRGDAAATLICHQDGGRDDVPAAFWFREHLDPIEELALDLCRGQVLDVGAGTGVHSLKLQNRGYAVTAIDVASECVAIMQERGVRSALLADVYEFPGPAFDTVLSLCNGLDKVGRFSELPGFLTRVRKLLGPGGQFIVDSYDLRIGADAAQLAEMARKDAAGRYFGELDMRFEYKARIGAPFTVLQVDFETLRQVAEENGLRCEMVKADGGHYLARATAVIGRASEYLY